MKYFSLFSVITALTIMLFSSCGKKNTNIPRRDEKIFNMPPFHSIYTGDGVKVTIKRAGAYKIIASGTPEDLQRISCRVMNDVLDVSLLDPIEAPVELTVELPVMHNLRVAGASMIFASGFGIQSEPLNIVCSGRSIAAINGVPQQVNIETGGLATLELIGATNNLKAQVSADGKMNGYALHAKNVNIEISERGSARVLVDSSIHATISGDARLYYKGNPPVSSFQVTGNGMVIHE